jgi:hypothetical protein
MQAAAGEQSASPPGGLANRMEQADRATGGGGKAAEAWKKATGGGDGVTALKQEYARIVNNQALGSIKEALGGRVTDVDMKVAMGVGAGRPTRAPRRSPATCAASRSCSSSRRRASRRRPNGCRRPATTPTSARPSRT